MKFRTISQFCEDEGISRYVVDKMIADKELDHLKIRTRTVIPNGAIEKFIEENRISSCQDETTAQDSIGSKNDKLGTLSGQKTDAAISAALALNHVKKLKSYSQNGSEDDS